MNNYKKYKNQILDYFYLLEDDYIKTYGVVRQENVLYKVFLDQFNYHMYGERMIEKLRGRDYLSNEECIEKYSSLLPLKEEIKTKKNSLFRKRK